MDPSNINQLLQQIQSLSELQNRALAAKSADPAAQAAYIAKLQHQADSIKKMLKFLNSSGSTANLSTNVSRNSASSVKQHSLSDLKADLSERGDKARHGGHHIDSNLQASASGILDGEKENQESKDVSLGYEQLWELGVAGGTIRPDEAPTEVEESEDYEDDFLADQRDLYENTSVGPGNGTCTVDLPPPLPPRLPSRHSSFHQVAALPSDLGSDRSNSSWSSKPNPQSTVSTSSIVWLKKSDTDKLTSNSPDWSTPRQSAHYTPYSDQTPSTDVGNSLPPSSRASGGPAWLTSTPVEARDHSNSHVPVHAQSSNINSNVSAISQPDENQKSQEKSQIAQLQERRLELINSLQSEEQEKQWHFTQLELIAQKIRAIPLSSPHSYSLENEAARQELEERAARIQANMQRQLGDPDQALRKRRLKIEQVREIDRQLEEMNVVMRDDSNKDDLRENRAVAMRQRQQGIVGADRLAHSQSRPEDSGGRRNGQTPQSCNLEQLYHESLPSFAANKALSHSGPPAFGGLGDDAGSVMSFTSSIHSVGGEIRPGEIGEAASSLLSLLGCTDVEKMSRTLLAMSSSPANCDMMRGNRCIPLLVQLLHIDHVAERAPRPARPVRARAARCLHNIVHAHPNDKHCKREAKVLKLLEVLRQYCDLLRDIVAASEGRGGSQGRKVAELAGCRRVTIQVVEGGEKYAEQDLMVCDFGDLGEEDGGPKKQVYACHNFIDYSGDAKQTGQVINIEESMAVLTRCSFDESHRQPIFLLGGIPALAELIQIEHDVHADGIVAVCREVRRYAVVALTNLTFGNTAVKSYLCQYPGLVTILVDQLESPWENLRKATAHLFRNLAWKADKLSKGVLSESQVVSVLMSCSMAVSERCRTETPEGKVAIEPGKDEPTLKVILSALWNLSAHCRKNKSDVCSFPGSLQLLVQFLRSRSTAIVENGGGILRNVSSYIATADQGEQYRQVLRDEECLSLLLSQLRSPSLTIVSNACGTLWNFSARNQEDQEKLWELGAVPMLQSLTNSKHKTISTCSLAALKNLYTAKPSGLFMMVSGGSNGGATGGHQLTARKVKNLVADLDEKLSDCGRDDVEGGREDDEESSGGSSAGSDNDDDRIPVTAATGQRPTNASGTRSRGGHSMPPPARPDSRNSVSSMPSVSSQYSDTGSQGPHQRSASPDRSSASQSLQATHYPSRSRSLEPQFQSGAGYHHPGYPGFSYGSKNAANGVQSTGEPGVAASGHMVGQYSKFVKAAQLESGSANSSEAVGGQHARLNSPLRDNYLMSGERVAMSPGLLSSNAGQPSAAHLHPPVSHGGSLQMGLSPGSVPLDLSKKSASSTSTSEAQQAYYQRPDQAASSAGPNNQSLGDEDEQPTDYSLRYQEAEDADITGANNRSNNSFSKTEVSGLSNNSASKQECEDTVRTYYTEGTPMDTPYAFSTATSLSDLRDPPAVLEEVEDEDKAVIGHAAGPGQGSGRPNVGNNDIQADTTTTYAVEGTPNTGFSRADSLSSLESGDNVVMDIVGGAGGKLSVIPESVGLAVGDNNINSADTAEEEKGMSETGGEKEGAVRFGDGGEYLANDLSPQTAESCDGENAAAGRANKDQTAAHKTVTFTSNPQETPLMFSRASSVASLDSFDQQSIRDGYSSCDFSRATSGRVSPSDLPDSPSQTMPASPRAGQQGARGGKRQQASEVEHPQERAANMRSVGGQYQPPLAPRSVKPMFEDGMQTFQEEGTPFGCSTRTSLSGLSFPDDEMEGGMSSSAQRTGQSGQVLHQQQSDQHDGSGDDDEEDDIYADSESLLGELISSGMPHVNKSRGKTAKVGGADGASSAPPAAMPRPQPQQVDSLRSHESSFNDGGQGSDDSADNSDILEACIASAMPAKKSGSGRGLAGTSGSKTVSAAAATSGSFIPGLGHRQAAEGAPSDPSASAVGRSSRLPTNSKLTSRKSAPVGAMGYGANGRLQASGYGSGQQQQVTNHGGFSHPCVAAAAASSVDIRATAHPRQAAPRSQLTQHQDPMTDYDEHLPRSYRVEDTPRNFSAATSLSDLTIDDEDEKVGPLGRGKLASDRNRHQHDEGFANRSNFGGRRSGMSGYGGRSRLQSGSETMCHYATEGTPGVFSRNDSLSSLEIDEDGGQHQKRVIHADGDGNSGAAHHSGPSSSAGPSNQSPASFQSFLPRPLTVGRSASSESSVTGGGHQGTPIAPRPTVGSNNGRPQQQQSIKSDANNYSLNSSTSVESLDNDDDDENLLADCISSAMPKSKSENFDLAGKLSSAASRSRKSPRRGNPRTESGKSGKNVVRRQQSREGTPGSRGNSKSPRNSRIIPGVPIPELKLRPRTTPPRSRPHSTDLSYTADTSPAPRAANQDEPPGNSHQVDQANAAAVGQPDQPANVVGEMLEAVQERSEPASISEDKTLTCDQGNRPFSASNGDLQKEHRTEAKEFKANFNINSREPGKPIGEMEPGDMAMTLTQSRVSELESSGSGPHSTSWIAREARALAATLEASMLTSSQCSESALESLNSVQPPSIMLDSLPSLTGPPSSLPPPQLAAAVTSSPARRPSAPLNATGKLECRHTLSGKLGSSVPLAVRRALGGSTGHIGSSQSHEDLSSLSSCQSNLDNIRPPTIMDDMDMDNSMMSVASISSELAVVLTGSGGSDDPSISLTSEAIMEVVRPVTGPVPSEMFAMVEGSSNEPTESDIPQEPIDEDESLATLGMPSLRCAGSVSQLLECVEPPTLVEDTPTTTTMTTGTPTLCPDNNDGPHTLSDAADGRRQKASGAVNNAGAGETFVIEEAGDTIADVTDVFDEEASYVDPQLGHENDAVEEIPDLPRDASRHATPAQSGGESSVEGTPIAARKRIAAAANGHRLSPKERRAAHPERYLTYTKHDTAMAMPPASSGDLSRPSTAERTDTSSGYRTGTSHQTLTMEHHQPEQRPTRNGKESDSLSEDVTLVADQLGAASLEDDPRTAATNSHSSSNSSSIRQRRAEESDRFKTHTITSADLPSKAPGRHHPPSSPGQRDILEPTESLRLSPSVGLRLSAQEAAMLEAEARLVVRTINERKAEVRSRSTSVDLLASDRSRSVSVELLDDNEMRGFSVESLLDDDGEANFAVGGQAKPRICKPWESRLQQDEVGGETPDDPANKPKPIRGRRRNLYSPPMKRATVPPALAPKPATKANAGSGSAGRTGGQARANSSPVTSPRLQPRTTRTMALRRAANAAADHKSPELLGRKERSLSPRIAGGNHSTSQRGVAGANNFMSSGPGGRATVGKASRLSGHTSPSASRTQSPQQQQSGVSVTSPSQSVLVRQGTFTKDEPSATANSSPSGSPAKAAVSPSVAAAVPTGKTGRTSSSSQIATSAGYRSGASNVRQASSISLRSAHSYQNRTPPKVPPKPALFGGHGRPRGDTVQPSPPASTKPLVVGTTKTQTLREQSLSRGGVLRSSNSSTASSVASSRASNVSKTSLRTSSSNHSLKSAAGTSSASPRYGSTASATKRTPSSSELERRKTSTIGGIGVRVNPAAPAIAGRPVSPAASESRATKPKKDVTSKIASLWKRVEDSKRDAATKAKIAGSKTAVNKDKRVWISRGAKVQPPQKNGGRDSGSDNRGGDQQSNWRGDDANESAPAPGKLIRSGTYEKLTVEPNTTAAGTTVTDSASSNMKPRSKSRLSIKLSKFSLKKHGKSSTGGNPAEDHMNGNSSSACVSPTDEEGNLSVPSSTVTTPRDAWTEDDDQQRLSNDDGVLPGPNSRYDETIAAGGDFDISEGGHSSIDDSSSRAAHASARAASGRSSAMVPPSTGGRQSRGSASSGESMSTGPDPSEEDRSRGGTALSPSQQHYAQQQQRSNNNNNAGNNNRSPPASAVVAPFHYVPSSTMHSRGTAAATNNAQVKRNSSYVSSMGRRLREEDPSSTEDSDTGHSASGKQPKTSSSVVTEV